MAILLVLASHLRVGGWAVEGGFAGVTLFFVLSGYLITGQLVAEWQRSDAVNLRAFYLRRVARLFPALAAMLAVVAVGYALRLWPQPPIGNVAEVIISVIAYVSNWVGITVPRGVLGHTWSLAIEEQFYLAWPLLLLTGLRTIGARRTALAALAVAILVTPWRLVLAANYEHLFNGIDTHADGLLLGCAVALLAIRLPTKLGWLGLAALTALGAFWVSRNAGLVAFTPLATVASVVALAGCPPLTWRPLVYVGRISYGLYLWHFLFLWWGWPTPVVAVISFAVAIASFELLEQPARARILSFLPELNLGIDLRPEVAGHAQT